MRNILASNRFFYGVIAVLVLQATWVALTGRYPMAYDEQNHMGITRLYVEHISPFWAEQPPGDAPYSAIARDPSYLYHFGLSFLYRLIGVFFQSEESKIISFRLLSVAMFALGIWLYRKVLLRTKASRALVHTVFALFVLIPTVPFLAAQVNYDNLLFPMLAGLLLLTMQITDDIRNKSLDARRLALFVGIGMLMGLVKFPALPMLLAMAIWIVWQFFRVYKKHRWKDSIQQIGASAKQLRRPVQVALVLLVLFAGVLFVERYGINTIRYGTPVPACDQVLDETRCMAFGPWKRNYDIAVAKENGTLWPIPPSTGPIYFTSNEWLNLLLWQFFYALNGPADGFSVGFPFPLPYFTAVTLLAVGTLAAVFAWRYVAGRPYIKGLLFVAVLYITVLWIQNYIDFRELHLATAIQARYIVPVLPILLLALGLGFSKLLQKFHYAKSPLTVLTLLILITQGGGIGVYILRSNEVWWWPNSIVISASKAAQKVLDPLNAGGSVTAPKKNY